MRAADVLKDEGYKVRGNAPIYAMLREARDRAKAAGAKIEERPIQGAAADALVDLTEEDAAARGPEQGQPSRRLRNWCRT